MESIRENWKYYLTWVGTFVGILLILTGVLLQYVFIQKSEDELVINTAVPENTGVSKYAEIDQKESTPASEKKTIMVDVSGAVNAPGVYELANGARLTAALEVAGGLNKGADSAWVARNINLATKINDGDKIYIPKKGESATPKQPTIVTPSSPRETTTPQVAGVTTGSIGYNPIQTESPQQVNSEVDTKISINSASKSELDTLPGVGEVTAQKIIDNRPYKTLEEVKEKKSVNKSTYEKIKDKIKL